MSKLTARARQWLTRYETDPEIKQLLTQVLTTCETEPQEIKQLLTQVLVKCETEPQEIKQLLTQVLAKCVTEPQEIKQLLAQVQTKSETELSEVKGLLSQVQLECGTELSQAKQLLTQVLTTCETEPQEIKQLLTLVLAKCETEPQEIKQLLAQATATFETDLSEAKQLLTQVLTKCEADTEAKQLLTQVRESCFETLNYMRKTPQTIYAAKETYEIHRRKKFIKDKTELDLRGDYVKLLRGLDIESIRTVNTILARTEALSATDQPELELFNEDEQQQIRTLRTNFWPNIFQLDKGCFAYMDYLLPVNHFEPSVFFYRHELHHLTSPERVGEKAIMDIGGFIGDSALVLAKEFKGQIHSFEPTYINYQHMLQTIAMNQLSERVIPVNLGIADTARQAFIYIAGSGSSEYPVRVVKGEPETAEMITLDSYVAERGVEVGLIKVDIEGAEQDMLRGAENTIRTQRPTLIISIYHSAYDFFHIKPMLESWDLGYTFKIRRPVDGHIMGETVLLAEVG